MISIFFSDHPLIAGAKLIRAFHIAELRQRIDALRVRLGLAAYDYMDRTLTAGTTFIKAQHIIDLRRALLAPFQNAGRLCWMSSREFLVWIDIDRP